jgi:hypothetical protein
VGDILGWTESTVSLAATLGGSEETDTVTGAIANDEDKLGTHDKGTAWLEQSGTMRQLAYGQGCMDMRTSFDKVIQQTTLTKQAHGIPCMCCKMIVMLMQMWDQLHP